MIKKIILTIMVIFGVIFLGTIIHEGIHTAQAQKVQEINATSLCWNFNTRLNNSIEDGTGYAVAMVTYKTNGQDSFWTWAEFAEKQVDTIMMYIFPIITFILGLILKEVLW